MSNGGRSLSICSVNQEYSELIEGIGEGFDPEAFDADRVNKAWLAFEPRLQNRTS